MMKNIGTYENFYAGARAAAEKAMEYAKVPTRSRYWDTDFIRQKAGFIMLPAGAFPPNTRRQMVSFVAKSTGMVHVTSRKSLMRAAKKLAAYQRTEECRRLADLREHYNPDNWHEPVATLTINEHTYTVRVERTHKRTGECAYIENDYFVGTGDCCDTFAKCTHFDAWWGACGYADTWFGWRCAKTDRLLDHNPDTIWQYGFLPAEAAIHRIVDKFGDRLIVTEVLKRFNIDSAEAGEQQARPASKKHK